MITILLATYNGERYLAKQIESILAQTVKNWRLVMQDDCSTDGTVVVA
ncbi:MAG: glycosyltransferase, partial [Bacillota bacterium]